MSYRTNWKLNGEYICGERKDITKLDIKEIEIYISENEDMNWVFSEGFNNWGEDDRSFSNSDENMCKLSKTFSNILFTLKYEMVDDTQDGMYTEYWLNGEVQKEKLQYYTPNFDVNKLKEYC